MFAPFPENVDKAFIGFVTVPNITFGVTYRDNMLRTSGAHKNKDLR